MSHASKGILGCHGDSYVLQRMCTYLALRIRFGSRHSLVDENVIVVYT